MSDAMFLICFRMENSQLVDMQLLLTILMTFRLRICMERGIKCKNYLILQMKKEYRPEK
jgi:hypothetical protein